MRRAVVAVALSLGLAGSLPAAVALAGGRLMSTGGHGGFRSSPDFHSRQGLAGGYRSPGNFFARDSLVGQGTAPGISPGGSVSWAPLLTWPTTVYSAPTDPAPPAVVVAPVTQVYSTVYVTPAAGYPPAAMAPPPAPAAPPMPTVVEHATGRYELRGDGLATPYAWVWVPNPPPASPPAPVARPPDESPPSRVYRWTDEEGTTYLTNRPEAVPERHRPESGGPVAPRRSGDAGGIRVSAAQW